METSGDSRPAQDAPASSNNDDYSQRDIFCATQTGGVAAERGRQVPASLVKKLAEVMAAIERIPKRGHNDFHKYDYATEADIAATVRLALAARAVILVPEIKAIAREQVGDKGNILTTIRMTFTFMDGETGECIERQWYGCGTDKEDKGLYKALTGAEKYFLLKTFLMPTGDDPERDDKRDHPATVKPSREVQQARQALPKDSGAVYITKTIPRHKGNVEWTEVTFSDGESLIARPQRLAALCAELAQGTQAVIRETHQNEKGHTELDMVRRWPNRNEHEESGLLDAEMVL